MNGEQLKEANDNIEQDYINFYLSKHISEVRNMSDIGHYNYFRGQQLYADRCKDNLNNQTRG